MFNTLSYARKLESVGVSRDQAEAHVQIIAEIIEGDLATKQHIKDLRNDLENKFGGMESRLIIKLGVLMTSLITLGVAVIALLLQNR